MSVHYESHRQRYVVRWREEGRNRARRFRTDDQAEAFDAAMRSAPPPQVAMPAAAGDGIHVDTTKAGVRYRYVFRQSDGTLSSRRGFTSRQAATIARRRLVESSDRGAVRVARETFGTFRARYLDQRPPYLTDVR